MRRDNFSDNRSSHPRKQWHTLFSLNLLETVRIIPAQNKSWEKKPFQVLAGFCSLSQSLCTFLWLLRHEKNWRRSFPEGIRRHLKISNLICVKRSLLTQITRKLKREHREHPLSVLHSKLIISFLASKIHSLNFPGLHNSSYLLPLTKAWRTVGSLSRDFSNPLGATHFRELAL